MRCAMDGGGRVEPEVARRAVRTNRGCNTDGDVKGVDVDGSCTEM